MSSSETDQITAERTPVGKPASMGDVARKITSRTTDFLAIGIVLAAALSFGTQIVSWWQAAPPANPAADPTLAAPGWDDTLQPVDLEFGDLPVALTRQGLVGDQSAAIDALVRHCRLAVEQAPSPLSVAGEAEIHLLKRIAELTPAAEEPGAWQVFVVDERFPLVAGVKFSAPSAYERTGHSVGNGGAVAELPRVRADGAGTASEVPRLRADGDHGGRRVVCYGLAMPAGEQNWTVFVVKNSPGGQSSPASRASIPLPRGAARTLSLRDERGGLLVGFSDSVAPQEWITFYDDLGTARGWTRSGAWSTGNESWAARYARREGGWVDVRFAKDRRGELTGVLQVIPQTSEQSN